VADGSGWRRLSYGSGDTLLSCVVKRSGGGSARIWGGRSWWRLMLLGAMATMGRRQWRRKAYRRWAPGACATGDGGGTPLSCNKGRKHELTAVSSGYSRQGWMVLGSKSLGHPLHSHSLRRRKNLSVFLGKNFSLSLHEAYSSFFLFVPQPLNDRSRCRVTVKRISCLFREKPFWVLRHRLCHLLAKRSRSPGSIVLSFRHV
jgi:hypothetical protein